MCRSGAREKALRILVVRRGLPKLVPQNPTPTHQERGGRIALQASSKVKRNNRSNQLLCSEGTVATPAQSLDSESKAQGEQGIIRV